MAKELELNKERADVEKYYKLLMSKVGKLCKGDTICLIHIGNLDVIRRILDSSPESNYIIIDKPAYERIILLLYPTLKNSFIATAEDNSIITELKKLAMKFDNIIMNPPYNGKAGLYAKITAKAAEKSDNVVCLSPYIFYQVENPSKESKRIIDFLNDRFESIEYVPGNVFGGAVFDKPIGLMHFIKDKKSSLSFKDLFYRKFKNKELAESILSKVKKYLKEHKNDTCNQHLIKKEEFDNYQFKIIMSNIRGHADKNGNPIWDWTTLLEKERQNIFTQNAKDIKTPNCQAIPFENEKMCKNFVSYANSDVLMFLIYSYKMSLNQSAVLKYLPFLDFTREWTDKDLQKEFSLSNEEMEYIKEEMKPFGWKTKENKNEEK